MKNLKEMTLLDVEKLYNDSNVETARFLKETLTQIDDSVKESIKLSDLKDIDGTQVKDIKEFVTKYNIPTDKFSYGALTEILVFKDFPTKMEKIMKMDLSGTEDFPALDNVTLDDIRLLTQSIDDTKYDDTITIGDFYDPLKDKTTKVDGMRVRFVECRDIKLTALMNLDDEYYLSDLRNLVYGLSSSLKSNLGEDLPEDTKIVDISQAIIKMQVKSIPECNEYRFGSMMFMENLKIGALKRMKELLK